MDRIPGYSGVAGLVVDQDMLRKKKGEQDGAKVQSSRAQFVLLNVNVFSLMSMSFQAQVKQCCGCCDHVS